MKLSPFRTVAVGLIFLEAQSGAFRHKTQPDRTTGGRYSTAKISTAGTRFFLPSGKITIQIRSSKLKMARFTYSTSRVPRLI